MLLFASKHQVELYHLWTWISLFSKQDEDLQSLLSWCVSSLPFLVHMFAHVLWAFGRSVNVGWKCNECPGFGPWMSFLLIYIHSFSNSWLSYSYADDPKFISLFWTSCRSPDSQIPPSPWHLALDVYKVSSATSLKLNFWSSLQTCNSFPPVTQSKTEESSITFLFPFTHIQFSGKFWRLFLQNISRVLPLLPSPLHITTPWYKPSSVTWIVLSPSCFCPHPSPCYSWQSKLSHCYKIPRALIVVKATVEVPDSFLTFHPTVLFLAHSCGKLSFPKEDTGDRIGGASYLWGLNTHGQKWDEAGWAKEK